MRLTARPGPTQGEGLPSGTTVLPLSNGRTGLLCVPAGQVRGLIVALHGAGGSASGGASILWAEAERAGWMLLAPASAGSTWDGLFGGPDSDAPALEAALAHVFSRQRIRPDRVAVAGFSDGASYALTLGLTNGDLFRKVVAFSPGFQAALERSGRPAFFVTHGTRDQVLAISRTSRRVVPALRRAGYEVHYVEFDGGHRVPERLREQAVSWLAGEGEAS